MAKENIPKRIGDMLEDFLSERSLELYQVDYRKVGKDWTLSVILDKPADAESEYVSIEECEEVTRFLSDRLDEEDFIDRQYTLEVSSPGLDRELLKEADYVRFSGRTVEVRLYSPMDGRKNLEAELVGKVEDTVILEENGTRLEIPKKDIAKINLAVIF